jgi:hypothetical protein
MSTKKEPVAVMLSPIFANTAARFPCVCPFDRMLRKFVFVLSLIVGTTGNVSAKVAAWAVGTDVSSVFVRGANELTTRLSVRRAAADMCQRRGVGEGVCIEERCL